MISASGANLSRNLLRRGLVGDAFGDCEDQIRSLGPGACGQDGVREQDCCDSNQHCLLPPADGARVLFRATNARRASILRNGAIAVCDMSREMNGPAPGSGGHCDAHRRCATVPTPWSESFPARRRRGPGLLVRSSWPSAARAAPWIRSGGGRTGWRRGRRETGALCRMRRLRAQGRRAACAVGYRCGGSGCAPRR